MVSHRCILKGTLSPLHSFSAVNRPFILMNHTNFNMSHFKIEGVGAPCYTALCIVTFIYKNPCISNVKHVSRTTALE